MLREITTILFVCLALSPLAGVAQSEEKAREIETIQSASPQKTENFQITREEIKSKSSEESFEGSQKGKVGECKSCGRVLGLKKWVPLR